MLQHAKHSNCVDWTWSPCSYAQWSSKIWLAHMLLHLLSHFFSNLSHLYEAGFRHMSLPDAHLDLQNASNEYISKNITCSSNMYQPRWSIFQPPHCCRGRPLSPPPQHGCGTPAKRQHVHAANEPDQVAFGKDKTKRNRQQECLTWNKCKPWGSKHCDYIKFISVGKNLKTWC